MKRAAIIPSLYKKGTFEMANKISQWLRDHSVESVFEFETDQPIDFAIALCGDGFAMKKAKSLAASKVPLIVVNFGNLGFLAAAEKDNWQSVLGKVISDRYTLRKQTLLSVEHYNAKGAVVNNLEAIGDVYIRHKARMIIFRAVLDGETVFYNVNGDGVVVATPVGATGYNLSAGGPLIDEGIVITPICPHYVKLPPKPAEDFSEIKIIYHGVPGEKDEGCLLFVDGYDSPINPGEYVVITKSSKEASLIIPEGFSFKEHLLKKLGAPEKKGDENV